MATVAASSIDQALIDSLYAEALVLADESRAWFDRTRNEAEPSAYAALPGTSAAVDPDSLMHWAGRHDPSLRIALSCESLRMTTRLMHVIAWLLMRRALRAGELPPEAAASEHNRLGASPDCDLAIVAQLPEPAQRLIGSSLRLHDRVAQLEQSLLAPASVAAPAVLGWMDQLRSRF